MIMQHRKPLKSPPPPTLIPTNIPKQFHKFKPIFIPMASLLSCGLLTFLLFFTISSATRRSKHTHHHHNSITAEVCKASRDSTYCFSSLSKPNILPQNATVLDAIQSALSVSSKNLDSGRVMIQDILEGSSGNLNRSKAAKTCLELLGYSKFRTKSASEALPRGDLKDARAWMSAALVFQYDSWSALKYVNDTPLVGKTMAFLNTSLIRSSSDALAMLVNYDVFGEKTASWGSIKTERDGFWEPVTGSDKSFSGSVPSGLKADVTVCKEEKKCDFKTVQEAVKAGPENADKRYVIWIKAGVYEETVRVPLEKKNVVFLGDGMGKTVITGSLNVGQLGMTTYNSATVGVIGDGFMASGLTIQNTAGPDAHQAVAFRSDSDLSIVENCEFLGNQDTLYAHSLRQYYKSCRIQGNVDFIFGNSAAFFQDCLILIAPRQQNPEKGENNAVTAHGRIDPAQSTGFVFQNCVINGTDAYMALYYSKPKAHKNFLGRPWKEYSRTIFIRCNMEALVVPDGWMPWSGDFALRTLYYGEFDNTGPGSGVSKRVNWSSQVPPEHVSSYSVQNFIQGDQWINRASLL